MLSKKRIRVKDPNAIPFDWKAKVFNTLADVNIMPYNVYLINLWTIIRNQLTISDDNTLFNRVMEDVQQVYNIISYNQTPTSNRLVTFYLPQSYYIQPGFIRHLSTTTTKVVKYADMLYRDLIPELTETKHFNHSLYLEFVKFPMINDTHISHILSKYLLDKSSLVGSIDDPYNNMSIMMLSHIPFDWFISSTCIAHIQYLESYTGNVYSFPKLISKILPKEFIIQYPHIQEYIPFNETTHLLFGDKYFVKGLLTIKQQREIILVLLEKYQHDLFRWIKNVDNLYKDIETYLHISTYALRTLTNQGGNQPL
jgi:hypothetical protein